MTIAKLLTLICALILVALSHAAALGAQPTQAALVKAWEEVQRDDPETVLFEKTGEGSYKFKTKRFPFDGELKLLKATVNDFSYGDDEEGYDVPAQGYVMGVIEYDLVGLPEEVARKYAHSYAGWQQNNTLYFDKEGGEWLSVEKYRAKMTADVKKTSEAYALREKSRQGREPLAHLSDVLGACAPHRGLLGLAVQEDWHQASARVHEHGRRAHAEV